MFKSISLAAALLTALTVSANAAPVLTNGGFEQNPPGGYGDNIGWDISPWVLGTGNSSNVVSVDGPGGDTWYDVGLNRGPGFDATGGAGHYLDITDGSNDFYQEFTPLCNGDVEFGAYFTTRGNGNGEATVTIMDASGNTNISTPAIISLPGGVSGTDPWQRASFTTTLTANTTYRFHVAMDDNMNIDNAFVNFGPSCELHDDFDHDPDAAPDFVFETTKICGPITQQEDGTLSATCEIVIAYDTGTFVPLQISLDESVFLGSSLTSTAITNITSADDWDCGALPVTSNSPAPSCNWNTSSTPPPASSGSTTLNVTLEFSPESGQSFDEARNCVNAHMYIGGGNFVDSGEEPICAPLEFEEEESTVETAKTCEKPVLSDDGSVSVDCQITLTYDSGDLVPDTVLLDEIFTVDGNASQSLITSISGDDNWDCTALPVANPTDSIGCFWRASSANPPPSGQVTSVFDVTVEIPAGVDGNWQEAKNCAGASLHFDDGGTQVEADEYACVDIAYPEDETDIDPIQCTPFEHEVTCDTVNGGYQISLSNTLTGTFDPSSIDVDVLTAGVTAVSNPTNPLFLTLQGATPGQSVQMSLSSIDYGAGSQPGLDLCCMGDIEVKIPDGLVCEPPRETVLEINKSCEPFDGGEALGNTVCHLDVIYSGPAPTPNNPIVITDSSNSSTGVLSFNGQDPTTAGFDEWDCSANIFPTTGPAVCVMHNAIDTTATAGYWDSYFATLDLYITTTDEYKNCATASVEMVDGSVVDYEACYTQSDADLEISKRALFDVCHPGQICQFEYTVSNIGTSPYNGNITLQDNITPIGGQIAGINPALCDTPSDLLGSGCTGSVNLTSSGSTTFVVDYRAPYDLGDLQDGELHAGRNCVTLQDETMGEFDDPTDIDGHQACTDFQIGKPLLEIEKIANGDGECLPGTECSYTINISTGDLPYDGRIALFEKMGGLGGTITSVTTLPSACTISDPVQCVLPIDLAANSTYSITVNSTYDAWDQDTSHNRNCVGAYMVDNTVEVGDWSVESLTQDNVIGMVGHDCVDFEQQDDQQDVISSKICEPITLGTLMVDGMLQDHVATIDCKITVTGENLQPGETVTLQDQFTQGTLGYSAAFGGFLDGTVTSTENWACADVNTAPTGSGDPISGACELPSDDLIAAGGSSELHVVFQIDGASSIQGPLENCITTGTTSDPITEGQEPDICAPIDITRCADGEMVQDGQCIAPPTITANKTCEPAILGPVGYQVNCAITVTSTGPLFTPYTIRDVLVGPNGMDSSKVTSITHTDNWHCGGQPPYAPGLSLACGIHPNNFPATLTSSLNYTMAFSPEDAQGDWENCMANNAEEPWGCVPIVFPVPVVDTPPSLEFEKTLIGECKPDLVCNFELTLTNTGTQTYQGNVAIADNMGGTGAQFTGSNPLLPAGCLDGAEMRCVMPVNLSAGSSTSWKFYATFTDYQDGEGHNRNCAVAGVVPASVPQGPFGAEPAWQKQTSPIGGEIRCVDFDQSSIQKPDVATPDPVAKPVLEPFKRLVEPCKVNKAAQTYSCEFEIGVKNVGNADYSGPVVLDDSFGQPKPRAVKTVGGEGWSCLIADGSGANCLNGSAQLKPGVSSSVNMAVTIPGLQKGGVFENCVGVGIGNNERLRATLAQTVMQRLGIDGGPVDGVPGRKTREGIKVLQEKLGLAPTGEIDNALFAGLGIPSTEGVQPECIQVDLPPMPQLPVSCKAGQQKNSAGKCYTPRKECPAGYRLNSKGKCYKLAAPLQCDKRSTVKSGSGCACRYKGMRNINARSCVCRNTGLAPIPGVGCPTVKIQRPKPDGPAGHDGEGSSCRIKINGICIK